MILFLDDDGLERALARLHELNGVLARYKVDLRWVPGDESLTRRP